MTFADRILKYRTEAGMTQDDLARRLGVTNKAVSAWETGKKQPRYPKVEKMAEIFGVSIPDLMGLTESEPVPEQNPDIHINNALRYINCRTIATVTPRYSIEELSTAGLSEEDEEELEQAYYVFDGRDTAVLTEEEILTIIKKLDWVARTLLVPGENTEAAALLNRLPGMDKGTLTLLSAAAKGLSE